MIQIVSSESPGNLLGPRRLPPDDPLKVRLRVLSSDIEVEGNCPGLLRQIAGIYPEPSSPNGVPRSDPDFHIKVARQVGPGGRSTYWAGQGESCRLIARSQEKAVAAVDYMIERATIGAVQHLLLFHAAAISTAVGAMLIPGVSGAGKSTLAAALALSGLECLGDDIAVIEPKTRSIHKFSRSICLKTGGWRALAAVYPLKAPVAKGRRWNDREVLYLPLPVADGSPSPDSRTLRFILFPVRRPGQPARVVPMSRAECIVALAGSSFNLPFYGRRGVEDLVRLVEGSTCCSLIYDDLPNAVSQVTALVGLRATQP